MADPVTLGAMAFSTILSASGQIAAGNTANNAAKYNAAAEQTYGTQQFAASQRSAFQERRKTDYTLSRAQAVAASSGGGATDPTVVNLEGGIKAQGEYNAMTALYQGQEAERQANTQAGLDLYQGKQAQKAGYIKGATTLLSGGSSLFDKYGGGGFGGGAGASDLPALA